MQQKIIIMKNHLWRTVGWCAIAVQKKVTYGAPLGGAPLLSKKKISNDAPLGSAPLL